MRLEEEEEETGRLTWRFPREWKAVISQYCFSTFLSSAVRKWSTFSCLRSLSEKMSFSFFQEAYSSSGKIFTATVSNCSDVVCFSLALYTWAKRPLPTWNKQKGFVRFQNQQFELGAHKGRCWGHKKRRKGCKKKKKSNNKQVIQLNCLSVNKYIKYIYASSLLLNIICENVFCFCMRVKNIIHVIVCVMCCFAPFIKVICSSNYQTSRASAKWTRLSQRH